MANLLPTSVCFLLLLPSIGCSTRIAAPATTAPATKAPAAKAPATKAPATKAPATIGATPKLSEAKWTLPPRPLCQNGYAVDEETGIPQEQSRLVEVSGLVASPRFPEVLWLHNDSGDDSIIYAVSTKGLALGSVTLLDTTLIDLEDVAAAPCPDASGPCLWLADTGNNRKDRTDLAIYAVPEPDLSTTRNLGEVATKKYWRFPIAYPNDAINSEALVVWPDASKLYLFEKTANINPRYFVLRAPFFPDQRQTVVEVGRFEAPGIPFEHGRKITGADLHPSAMRLVLRVYSGVYEYPLQNQTDLILKQIPPSLVTIGPMTERQGEAVGYHHSGMGIWTVSEDPQRKLAQPMHFFPCRAAPTHRAQ